MHFFSGDHAPRQFSVAKRWAALMLVAAMMSGLGWMCLSLPTRSERAVQSSHTEQRRAEDASAARKNRAEQVKLFVEKENAEKIREATEYWDAHKAHLAQVLRVDLPAAIARRDAAAPRFHAVVRFAQRQFAEVSKKRVQWQKTVQPVFDKDLTLQATDLKFGELRALTVQARALSDAAPAAEGLTISNLAHAMFSYPEGLQSLRDNMGRVERGLFNDEEKAQQAESCQTSEAALNYLQAAAARYEAAAQQAEDAAPLDAAAKESRREGLYQGITGSLGYQYGKHWNKEVDTDLAEYLSVKNQMDPVMTLLAERSRDDAESRRLLTEIADMKALLRQVTAGEKLEFDVDDD